MTFRTWSSLYRPLTEVHITVCLFSTYYVVWWFGGVVVVVVVVVFITVGVLSLPPSSSLLLLMSMLMLLLLLLLLLVVVVVVRYISILCRGRLTPTQPNPVVLLLRWTVYRVIWSLIDLVVVEQYTLRCGNLTFTSPILHYWFTYAIKPSNRLIDRKLILPPWGFIITVL